MLTCNWASRSSPCARRCPCASQPLFCCSECWLLPLFFWPACSHRLLTHADVLRDAARGKLASLIQERACGALKPSTGSLDAPKLDTVGASSNPAAMKAQLQLAQIARSVPAWGYTDGMRAVGTGSPSPAVTPPPVVQRQGPAKEWDLVAQLAGSRPGEGVGGDCEAEEARLRDAAEARLSHLIPVLGWFDFATCFRRPCFCILLACEFVPAAQPRVPANQILRQQSYP